MRLNSDITSALAGSWQLNRDIVSHDIDGSESSGTLTGQITFMPDEKNKLIVKETGTLTINQTNNEIYRNYIYELKNNKIYILYNDDHRRGDILHELDFSPNANGEITATHCHLCGQDEYTIQFAIQSENRITIDYNVRGPHKNYDMHSVLTRQQKDTSCDI